MTTAVVTLTGTWASVGTGALIAQVSKTLNGVPDPKPELTDTLSEERMLVHVGTVPPAADDPAYHHYSDKFVYGGTQTVYMRCEVGTQRIVVTPIL